MATTLPDTSQTIDPSSRSAYREIALNSLILGRVVDHAVFCPQGTLLIYEGAEITTELKEGIRTLKHTVVLVHQIDVPLVTLSTDSAQRAGKPVTFDHQLAKKLDAIVNSGLMRFENKGPALIARRKQHGRTGYDQTQRAAFQEQQQENGQQLNSMLQHALEGKNVDGTKVANIAGQNLKAMLEDTDSVLTATIDQFQADDLAGQSLEVSLLAMAIGVEMNLDEENTRHLAMTAMVHDWGMMRIPAEIRKSTEKLNAVQLLEIKKHPIHSLELLQQITGLPRVIPLIAYQVHERFNGKGYPRGRHGASIHQLARILQVADAFVGMTTARSYRPPMMRYSAMECLIRQAKDRYTDPEVVRALLNIQSLFPIGSFVTLSDGSIAQVIRRNGSKYVAPIVARIEDKNGEKVDPTADENILDVSQMDDLSVKQALPTPGSQEIACREDLYLSAIV